MAEKVIGAFFDLDGVIVDTEDEYTKFWNAQGEIYHPEIPNFALGIKGNTLVQVFDKFFAGNLTAQEKITKALDKFEREMPYEYISGVIDFVKSLKKEGVKTAIVTSSNLKKMASVFAVRPELKELFDIVITSEDVSKSKPDPESYLTAAKKLNCEIENGTVFEDSFAGLTAAKASKMRVVGLATTNSREKIEKFCDVVINDYQDVATSIIKK